MCHRGGFGFSTTLNATPTSYLIGLLTSDGKCGDASLVWLLERSPQVHCSPMSFVSVARTESSRRVEPDARYVDLRVSRSANSGHRVELNVTTSCKINKLPEWTIRARGALQGGCGIAAKTLVVVCLAIVTGAHHL